MQEISLAQFIQNRREKLGMSITGLSKKANVDIDILEKIESGQDLFLPVTVRQNLAKGLKCNPSEIKDLEKSFDTQFTSKEILERLKAEILKGEENLICPKCGSLLITRIAKMYDLEDNLMLHPKARCSKCVFQIKD